MTNNSLAKKASLSFSLRPVDKLIWENKSSRGIIFLQRAYCCHRKNIFYTQRLQSKNIGPVIYFMGQNIMFFSMARNEQKTISLNEYPKQRFKLFDQQAELLTPSVGPKLRLLAQSPICWSNARFTARLKVRGLRIRAPPLKTLKVNKTTMGNTNENTIQMYRR